MRASRSLVTNRSRDARWLLLARSLVAFSSLIVTSDQDGRTTNVLPLEIFIGLKPPDLSVDYALWKPLNFIHGELITNYELYSPRLH